MKISYLTYMVLVAVFTFCAGVSAQSGTTVGGDMGTYRVHCNVEGAQVYFDGDLKGAISQGILDVPVYVTGTPYRNYLVVKEGYYNYTGPINSVPGSGKVIHIYVTMTAVPLVPYGTLHVLVSPADSRVSLDGNPTEEVPVNGVLILYNVKPGKHTLVAEKSGYITVTQDVNMPNNGLIQVPINLQPVQYGSISVTSVPAGASVYLDGQVRGSTPITLSDIPSGSHSVMVQGEGYQEFISAVVVTPGATTQVDASLSPVTPAQGATRAADLSLVPLAGAMAFACLFFAGRRK
jgi:hypothetical protein